MAKDEPGNDGPSLELPSLGFGRKRRKKAPEPAPQPASAPEPEPEPVPEPASAPAPEREPVPEPASAPAPEPEPAPTELLPPAPPPVPDPAPAPPLFADEVATEAVAEQAGPEDSTPRRKARPRRELPVIGGMPAAIITGVLVGIITVGLTWGSLHLCEVVQGTSSCGNPGFFLLAAIMVVSIVLGGLVLKAWGVPDPYSTSFLAVGLLAVLALLFLVGVLFSWTMIIVIPAIAAATYALSHWVTTALIEPADD